MKIHLPIDAHGVDKDDPETWPVVTICDASVESHPPRFATHVAHIVQEPIDYCAECVAYMAKIYEALGTHLHVEELPLGATTRRLIEGTKKAEGE